MKHFGDITKIDGHKVPIVDIITGGSPCQDLSVAGKRAGLDGERSGLFMEQIRIIKEMHDECRRTNQPIRPRYMVWENVPGAFSSNNGEDFRIVLEETARVVDSDTIIPRLADGSTWSNSGCILADRWSIAWRVHDAQFWGVPQRRKRISLVADFRGQTAPEILFERKSVSRDSEQSEEKRQGTPENIGRCTPTISFQERAGCDGGVKESLSNTSEQVLSQPSITKPSSTVFGISPFDSNAMTFRKQAHPMDKEGGQGWESTDIADTLNVHDNSEMRTPILIVELINGRTQNNRKSPERFKGEVHTNSADLKWSNGNWGG